MFNMLKETRFFAMNGAVAASQATTTTAAIDLRGTASPGKYTNPTGTVAATVVPDPFDALCVVVSLATVVATATITVTLTDSTTSGGSYTTVGAAYADFATTLAANATVTQSSTNAGIIVTDVGGNTSNLLIVLDVALIQAEFVKAVVTTAVANVAINAIIGIAYRSKQRPTAQDSAQVAATGYFVANS